MSDTERLERIVMRLLDILEAQLSDEDRAEFEGSVAGFDVGRDEEE